jgi:hypothetical protein
MQNAGDQYSATMFEIKHDVHLVLEPVHSRVQVFAETAHRRVVREGLETSRQFANVSVSLGSAPGEKSVVVDADQI